MWKNIFNIYKLKNAGKYKLNIMYTIFDLTHTDSSISTHSPVHYLFKKKTHFQEYHQGVKQFWILITAF